MLQLLIRCNHRKYQRCSIFCIRDVPFSAQPSVYGETYRTDAEKYEGAGLGHGLLGVGDNDFAIAARATAAVLDDGAAASSSAAGETAFVTVGGQVTVETATDATVAAAADATVAPAARRAIPALAALAPGPPPPPPPPPAP